MQISRFIAQQLVFSPKKSFTKVLVGIAIASIALSVAIMITTMAIITGFKETITDKIFGFWGHVHITDLQVSRSYEPVPIAYDADLVQDIKTIQIGELEDSEDTTACIAHVQSFAFLPAIIKSKAEIEGIILKGINTDFNANSMDQYILEGSLPNLQDSIPSRDILISKQTANRVGVNSGDKIVLIFFRGESQIKKAFTVSGIYRTGLEEYDVKFALVDIRTVQQVLGWQEHEIAGYEIYTQDTEYLVPIADHIYNDIIGSNLYAETIREKFPAIFNWLDLQKVNEKVILLLMLIVCVINMSTIVLIVILERARMIGILKSLGAKDQSIRSIFLRFSFWIVCIGLVIGNIVGIGICLIQEYYPFIHLDQENYYVSIAPVTLKALHIIGINVLSIIVVVACMLLPTIVASRISPVKVLKFD